MVKDFESDVKIDSYLQQHGPLVWTKKTVVQLELRGLKLLNPSESKVC